MCTAVAGVGDWVSVSGWRCAEVAEQGSNLERAGPSDQLYTSSVMDCMPIGTAQKLLLTCSRMRS